MTLKNRFLRNHDFWVTPPFKEENLPFQNLIVTYSIEYRDYHRKIREHHIKRAIKKKKFKDEKPESSGLFN